MMKFNMLLIIFSSLFINSCAISKGPPDIVNEFENYDVFIERDIRGVPHVFGETDRDAAFGFAYAQAEDNWELIHDSIPFFRGSNAAINGLDAVTTDYLIHWLEIWDSIDKYYDSELSEHTKEYLNAFVDGLNFYASKHPESTNKDLLPITSKDIIAGYMVRHLLFYGFESYITELFEEKRVRPISIKTEENRLNETLQPEGVVIDNLPVGSNAIAVSKPFTSDQATRIAINSHQPATGPVAWYEAHIQSKEGLNVMGGLFPSSPTIGVGFNENLAWGATVNRPDLMDIFVLKINPNNSRQYLLDGEWQTFREKTISLRVKILGFLPWRVKRTVLYSKHGPAIETDHGTYAIRYAGMNEIKQVEQWLAMSKAKNFDEWFSAMEMHTFASFNFVYADREGNIAFIHNSMTPIREPGYNWNNYLPGDKSSLIWKDYMDFNNLPMVINPSSGYLISANQSPFFVTAEIDNPAKENYSLEDGFPTRMTNRAVRGLDLLSNLDSIDERTFFEIKHDKKYSKNSRAYKYLKKAILADSKEFNSEKRELYRSAQAILRNWDASTAKNNQGAALGTCIIGAEWLAEQQGKTPPDPVKELKRCADLILDKMGRLDPNWGSVNRHIRGDINVPLGGGPDVLRAIYGIGLEEEGYLTNIAGDGLYYLVSWDEKKRQKITGVHQFGSATLDSSSSHYSDQALDFANEVLHDPLFDDKKRQHLIERRYRPGE